MRGVRQSWAAVVGTVGLAGASVAAVGLPALGAVAGASGAPSASQVMAQAVTDLSGVPAFTLSGYVVQGTGKIGIDVRSTGKGGEAAGTMSLGSTKPGSPAQTLSFVELGSKIYLKANALFWIKQVGKLPAAVLKIVGQRWIVMSGASAKGVTSSFSSFTNAAALATGLLGGSESAKVHFGPTTTIRGVRVRAVVDAKADATMYVQATGEPLPLEFVGKQPGNGGDVVLGYPESLSIAAPAGAVTIQQLVLSALKG